MLWPGPVRGARANHECQQACPNWARAMVIHSPTIAGLIAPGGRMLSIWRSPMGEWVRGFVYQAAVITGGMAPVALLALALMLD